MLPQAARQAVFGRREEASVAGANDPADMLTALKDKPAVAAEEAAILDRRGA